MSTVERQPRGMSSKRYAPVGDLAIERGERVDTSKTIDNGGKPLQPTTVPTELEKTGAIYETLNDLGGDADWQEIAQTIHAKWGFTLTEEEINSVRARWRAFNETVTVKLKEVTPVESERKETTEVNSPSEFRNSPDR
jgi:hypothetical protein